MIYFIFLTILYFHSIKADQTLQCGDWEQYKDEKCYKVLVNAFQSYDDAKTTCYQNEGSSLVLIRSQDEQEFLLELTRIKHKAANNIWIGLNLKDNKLIWSDNTTVNYTNWDHSNPKNNSGYECVVMEMVEPYGEWIFEPCNQKNLVVCQKSQNWLFSYLHQTVMELRKNVENLTIQLENKSNFLDNTIRDLKIELNKSINTQINTETKLIKLITESTPPGTIAYFTNTTAPIGWLKANGQSVSRMTYANLFAIIGTSFGSGDGSNTFTLPDLRGEFLRGWSDDRDVDKNRVFGSFQWGSHIPKAGFVNNSFGYCHSNSHQDRWSFAGNTFDGGYKTNIPSGESIDGLTFPKTSDDFQSEMPYAETTHNGRITTWNVLKGTRPRNIALLTCIKY